MRPIDESVQNKVDNFPFWENFINVTDPDQFYFVQIIKRYKDNKGMSKAGNYHAGGEFYELLQGKEQAGPSEYRVSG